MVIAFSVIIRILEFFSITNDVLFSLIEITNIMNLQTNPEIIAALSSFGGICIIFQIKTISGLSLRKFILARIPIAVFSAGFCRLITRNLVIEATANPRIEVSSGGSVIASICLIIMTLILLQKNLSSYK
jgi:hypothetical protein